MAALIPGILQILLVFAALAISYRPLGDYMARVFTTTSHWRAERAIYRLGGINPDAEQGWRSYLRSLLWFTLVSLLLLYLIVRTQAFLPFSGGHTGLTPDQAWNTAVSFVTNTNWQSYSGEAAVGVTVQAVGLAVQNFLSAAVGLAVAVALFRGLARTGTAQLGNFWTDLVRGSVRILLPLSTVFAIVLLAGGVIQNLADPVTVHTLGGAVQHIPGGTVASQEAIKNLGTNGGGYFNANAAHPFENPSAWTNLLQVYLMLLIPVALTRTFGVMIGSKKHGYAILSAMGILYIGSLVGVVASELVNASGALHAAGAALEGKELRFGVIGSDLFAVSTTMTSTGATDAAHSSFTPLGGGLLVLNMVLGEISPGGVGSGMYGMLMIAILSVFIAGLMVGRTPEYLGKKIGPSQMKLASLAILVMPATVLIGTAIAFSLPSVRASLSTTGPHGLTELLYAFVSAANNNGSAFAGLSANTPVLNVMLGLVMLIGRFLPIILVLALASSFAEQRRVPDTAGTLPTHRPLFIGVMAGVALLVSALTFLPALALGPIAEALG
ncbi:potassium-transporting ATPase subunit KdpA [Mycetocola tolaasinivorans]|uniref:Potassium-transporting ATPase potassium-binding subunit n=1 Tax=Mycetocola tolaasinivorans TaxID=76635 RepID=A0A3L7A9I3_9MICO|nr:potassium-transporting ATPase subunit KdpA [Mycetocola tolaasinivorans]RLP76837.1 potassium-transporting ATPase subunit KdpA [Mycetocola tolaasinivorans]